MERIARMARMSEEFYFDSELGGFGSTADTTTYISIERQLVYYMWGSWVKIHIAGSDWHNGVCTIYTCPRISITNPLDLDVLCRYDVIGN